MRSKLFAPLAVPALVAVLAGTAGATPPALPPLPARWPTTVQLGLINGAGNAHAVRRSASFGFRYR
jgi:hypothetical protein